MTKSSNTVMSGSKRAMSRRCVDADSKPPPQENNSTPATAAQEDWGFLQMKTSNNAQVVRR